MTSSAIARLEVLQRGFGQALRTPLDRATGTLRARAELYTPELCAAIVGDAHARLAVYNRQYWFRLFGVMQQAYRLATALLGAWEFNSLAARFLLAHPPVGHDLGRAVEGFAPFVAADAAAAALERDRGLPPRALIDAIGIDDAFRAVFSAPEQPALRLGPADAARLPRARLRESPAFALVEEGCPLIELRRELAAAVPEQAVTAPAPHVGGRRAWAICRGPGGQRVLPLDAAHALLVRLLRTYPVADAVARLEVAAAGQPLDVERWFAEGLQLGFWSRLEDVA